jgi:hypothetical protein
MIKNYLILLFATGISLSLTSCDSFSAALQQVNQGMGNVCLNWQCYTSLYNPDTGEYDAKIRIKDDEGNDVESQEEAWLYNTRQEYGNAGNMGIFNVTSPYSGGNYQLNIFCTQWQQ